MLFASFCPGGAWPTPKNRVYLKAFWPPKVDDNEATGVNDNSRRQFFLQPQDPAQRRYEAIRAVVIDGLPIRKAAERFDFAYGTLRNFLSQFDRQLQEQETPHPLL